MSYTDEQKALIWLNSVCGFATAKIYKLLSVATACELHAAPASYESAIEAICGAETARTMLDTYGDGALLNRSISSIEKADISVITVSDERYPELLKETACAPIILYAKGDTSLLNGAKRLGVVGSRNPSRYGQDVTKSFVESLAKSGLTIVSGLARGIDAIAHRIALEVGGKTVAVLGCGIDKIYPADNAALYKDIAREGLIISEYAPGVPPYGYQFPERNRIISGISEGILVTEAGKKSGSLLTANNAIEQGRELFVIPSAINSVRGEGGNLLLQSCQGSMVLTPNDIAERLGLHGHRECKSVMQLDFVEEQVVSALGYSDMNFEELLVLSKLGVAELNSMLTKLELLGIIKKLENNFYGV